MRSTGQQAELFPETAEHASEARLRVVPLNPPIRVTLPKRATGYGALPPYKLGPLPAHILAQVPTGPVTFEECRTWQRSCRLTSCKWNSATMSTPHLAAIPGGCMLRLVEKGGATLDEVAVTIGCTREAVRKIEARALVKLRVLDREPRAPARTKARR